MSGFSQLYNITDLGSRNDQYSEAHGINLSGNVVGEYEATNSISVSAFLYENGTRTNLGFLAGAPYAVAYGINDTNQIVGESNAGANTHAFEYTNGTMTDLGTLWGSMFFGTYSSAHAINGSGQIVGESNVSFAEQNTIHAVRWSGGTIKDLGALAGNYSSAYGVNSDGIIVGETQVAQLGVTNDHAFVYTNNAMQELGTLPGGDDYSAAFGINNSGVIVGESDTSVPGSGVTNLHAFIYRNGAMSDLGTLGGDTSSASAINNAGQAVGYAVDSNGVSCAFLYNGSTMINLCDHIGPGTLFTNLASADAINDAGQISGSGFLADGSYHAYLLTPAGPLLVAITNPAANDVFSAPATFVIGAYVADTAGTVTNVQFLVGSNVIAKATSAPYSAAATNLPAGAYRLTAVAADNGGLRATNSITVSVINSSPTPTITLTDPGYNSAGFSFSFATQTGLTYSAQFTTPFASSNNWLTFTSLAGIGSVIRVTNAPLTNAQRYYRVTAQ